METEANVSEAKRSECSARVILFRNDHLLLTIGRSHCGRIGSHPIVNNLYNVIVGYHMLDHKAVGYGSVSE